MFPVFPVLAALRQGRKPLDDQPFLVVIGLQAALHRKRCGGLPGFRSQQLGGLLQNLVLKLMHFVERGPKRQDACHGGHGGHGQRDGACQPELQRLAQACLLTIHPAPRMFLMASLPSFLRRL